MLLGTSSSSALQSDCDYEWIVDPPLETSEGTYHDDSGHEASPESLESDLLIDSAHLLSDWAGFVTFTVQFWDHSVSGVWDNGAENTGKVTWGEGDAELGGFVVIFFSFSEDVIVEELDEPFESDELDYRVRNLTSPERANTFVQSCGS